MIQKDYEAINQPKVFNFEERYAIVLKLLAITMFYSAGIPALYAFAAIAFLIQFMVDKFLLLNC